MNILTTISFLLLITYLPLEASNIELDSTKLLRGTWYVTKDSINTSIGTNANSENYDRSYWIHGTLTFAKKRYNFKKALKVHDEPLERGFYSIRKDTLNLSTKNYPYNYYYKINKLTETELIIEQTMYLEALGVFRHIVYYRKEK